MPGVYPLVRAGVGVAVDVPEGPLRLGPIIGVGRNYADHAKEMGADRPERPMLFNKNPASACLSGDDIVIPTICQDQEQVDYEGELAVIIGKPARDVPSELFAEYVLGYACANDVSARWWQKKGSGGQFFRGKSFDTFCPIGPHVAPASAVPDPQALRLTTDVSGKREQDDSTSLMLFPIAELVSELSRGTTLAPGTVILTGTPKGVGHGQDPPRYLHEGDEVTVSIRAEDGSVDLGTLTNRVRLEA